MLLFIIVINLIKPFWNCTAYKLCFVLRCLKFIANINHIINKLLIFTTPNLIQFLNFYFLLAGIILVIMVKSLHICKYLYILLLHLFNIYSNYSMLWSNYPFIYIDVLSIVIFIFLLLLFMCLTAYIMY